MKTKYLLNRNVRLAFGSATLTLIVVGVLSYRGVAVTSASDQWVSHAHAVLAILRDSLSATETLESSSRGYILTGQQSYIDTYRGAVQRLRQNETALRNLTADNPNQQLQIPSLEDLTARKIQLVDALIDLRRGTGLQAAADAIQASNGQEVTDEFENLVGAMRDEELRLLKLRDADAKRRVEQTKVILMFGTVLGLLIALSAGWSVLRDNSGRGVVEEALRDSEEKYRMLLDGVQDYAIFMLDPRGQVVSWNAGAERIQGYTAEEIIGRKFSCFFPQEDIKRGRPDEILRITSTRGRHEEQGMSVRKDGSRFSASVTYTALRDTAGNLRGFSQISRDLSESKESGTKYRALLEAAPDAMVVVNQGGEIVLLNVQAEKVFGYRCDELVGQEVTNIIPEGFAERVMP